MGSWSGMVQEVWGLQNRDSWGMTITVKAMCFRRVPSGQDYMCPDCSRTGYKDRPQQTQKVWRYPSKGHRSCLYLRMHVKRQSSYWSSSFLHTAHMEGGNLGWYKRSNLYRLYHLMMKRWLGYEAMAQVLKAQRYNQQQQQQQQQPQQQQQQQRQKQTQSYSL